MSSEETLDDLEIVVTVTDKNINIVCEAIDKLLSNYISDPNLGLLYKFNEKKGEREHFGLSKVTKYQLPNEEHPTSILIELEQSKVVGGGETVSSSYIELFDKSDEFGTRIYFRRGSIIIVTITKYSYSMQEYTLSVDEGGTHELIPVIAHHHEDGKFSVEMASFDTSEILEMLMQKIPDDVWLS